ncbi:30S ribosomal protein S13 [Candidatus Falkowbacteria bacterium RIFOXYC2_FULL_48_21]|uniref:Small ribosomal subunit protein uS13 n=1 Tax=Candidatus Falkowbacteria bacterium RIFOXYC2_FULL_48_21 TaxID=1798005 RepID=A0A1F5TE17_9BACT|nr:MAG: 30S ribosomal protein S13 [Candidatus Falkowbacteria bacterium RIFOXYC2_FULL_48_21]
MAARIAGVNLPNEKSVVIALSYLYGIGYSLSAKILKKLDIKPEIKVKNLTDAQVNDLRTEIEKNYQVEGNLRRDVLANIKRLKEIRSYRGSRHAKGLPARGQRTKTNNRTVRGNVRKTMGSGRKPAGQKT